MSFDLLSSESSARLSSLRTVSKPDPGMFDNFLSGTATYTMQGFAKAGRAVSLAGAVLPIIDDAIQGGTQAKDRYFEAHDRIMNRAVDYWTPNRQETGAAAEVAGGLLSALPLIMGNPVFGVAQAGLAAAEDAARKGADPLKSAVVGAVQAGGLGLGVWAPILGNTGFQRMVIGGGFNVAQGVATRAASGAILSGEPGAEDWKAFDWSAVTLDALLGVAFGGMAHLSPAQRAQGEKAWAKISEFMGKAKPSDIDALAALRQAQHLNADSMPGRPVSPEDVAAHYERARTALDQLANDQPVHVEDMPAPRVEPDTRMAEGAQVVEAVRAETPPDFLSSIEAFSADAKRQQQAYIDAQRADMQAIVDGVGTDHQRALPINQRMTVEEAKARLDELGRMAGELEARYGTDNPAIQAAFALHSAKAERPTSPADPLSAEASQFAAEYPALPIPDGINPDGSVKTITPAEFLARGDDIVAQANEDAKLLEVAAQCMLGAR